MNKLTITIESTIFLDKEINTYLSSLKGVLFSKIDIGKNEIYIEYNSKIISPKRLKMEISLFLDIKNTPIYMGFNKHSEKNTTKDIIIIEDLCCEYCLKGMIEDLFEKDTIKSAYTNFNYIDKDNVKIYITYDNDMLSLEDINKIKKEFNNL